MIIFSNIISTDYRSNTHSSTHVTLVRRPNRKQFFVASTRYTKIRPNKINCYVALSDRPQKHERSGRVFYFFIFYFFYFLECPNKKTHSFGRKINKIKILTNNLFTVCFLLIVSLYFGLQKKYIL